MVKPNRERLRRAFGLDRRAAPENRPAEPGDSRELLRRHHERAQRRRVVVELPPGEEVENARGHCFVRRLRYPLTLRHGSQPLALGLTPDLDALAELGKEPSLAQLDPRRCVFLDTETTGLSGGAGTTVFMTGLAFFAGDELVLEQLFLRDFTEEPAALQHVAERLEQFPMLVSYVGKSFDRHRLAARMAVQKVHAPILTADHLDLYYAARRAWGNELPDVKLRTVEERRLGFRREDDLPGSEAPVAFLQWLRDGTGAVDRVFEHNRLDVLSLVVLLGVLGR